MNARTALANDFIAALPAETRKRLKLVDLQQVTGAVLVKDRIEQFFVTCYQHEARLRRWKVSQGYCGGYSACMAFVGKDAKHQACDTCRAAEARRKRAAPEDKHPYQRSAYGTVRAKERELERKERARKA